MARIDRREPRREQGDEGGLRTPEPERHLVVAIGDYRVEVAVPGLARVDAKRLARLALQQIPGALDVAGGERLAVVPLDAPAQLESEAGPGLTPLPLPCEIATHRLHPPFSHPLAPH